MVDDAERQCLAVFAHVLMRHGQHARALAVLRALARLFPTDLDVAKCLSYASLSIGDDTSAIAAADAYLAGIKNGNDGGWINLLRGRALARMGRQEEAAQALQGFLDTAGREKGARHG